MDIQKSGSHGPGAIATLATMLFVASVTAGCTPTYNPSSFIERYRVIGIRAEPPTVTFTPEFQGRVDLTIVDAVPIKPFGTEKAPVINSIEWSVCLMSLGGSGRFQCAFEEIPLSEVSADGRSASFDGAILAAGIEMLKPEFSKLINGLRQSIQFGDDCMANVIAAYDGCLGGTATDTCADAAFEGFKGCIYGEGMKPVFHVKVSVTEMKLNESDEPVMDDRGEPVMVDRTVDAFKSVSFWDWGPDKPANHNPEFSIFIGVAAEGEEPDHRNLVVDSVDGRQVMELNICPGEFFEFMAVPNPELLDPELGPDGMPLTDADGNPVPEFFQLSWYANAGRWEKLRTGSKTADGSDPDLSNSIKFPFGEAIPETTVTVVMRDDMYGLTPVTFKIGQESRRNCIIRNAAPVPEGGAE